VITWGARGRTHAEIYPGNLGFHQQGGFEYEHCNCCNGTGTGWPDRDAWRACAVLSAAGGAAPKAAQFLEEKGVTLLAAGDFGDTFIAELEERGIRHARLSGSISDAVAELIG
jgi:hypothetical protein